MIDVLFVHEVLKRNNIKLNNERKKKCEPKRKNQSIFFEILLCITSYDS